MGKIKKILENELVGGAQNTDVYPVTSVKAVYDENNERLDHILARRGVVNVSTNYNGDHIAEILTLSQAIAKVPSSDRVLGFTMTFLSSNGWKTYQFTGNSISNWSDTTKWDLVLHSSEVLQELGDSKTAPVSQKVVKDNVNELKFPFLSIKKSLTLPKGTRNYVDYVYHNFYAKGRIRITIDKSNFPLDIPYLGTQIRNDKGIEITTHGGDKFTIDSFDSSYLSIGCNFQSNVSKNIVIPYTIKVLQPSPYEEQTRQIIEDITSDGLIPAGISTKRFENFQDFNIYGYGSSVSILKDSSGNYDTPPIRIAGGGISNITVIEDGGVTAHLAYCVHTDTDTAKGRTLRVDNSHFISNSGPCWGVGTRNDYTIEFRNCVFERTTDNGNDFSGVCWYSHNTIVTGNIPSLDDKSKVIFIGCTFISNKKYCMRLQDWVGDTSDYCEWTFINCTFKSAAANTDDAIYIEYKGYPDELGAKKFKHKFSLSEKSCGNNVSWLNYNN